MKKIWKGLQALVVLLKDPSLLYHIYHRPASYQSNLRKQYPYLSIGFPVVTLDQLIEANQVVISIFSFKRGTSEIQDLVLLSGLSKKLTPCRYLELGTFRGESLLAVAPTAKGCVSISLDEACLTKLRYPKAEIEAQDLYLDDLPDHTALFREDSQSFDFGKLPFQPNLVFIDADHHYESVRIDTANVFNAIEPKTSVVVWHDYLNPSLEINFEVMKGILDGIDDPLLIQRLYHVDTTKCVVYWPFEAPSVNEIHPYIPTSTYTIKVSKN